MIGNLMAFVARNARTVLILGLVAGIALPQLAMTLRDWIGPLVAGLLFLAALRVGPRQAIGALSDVGVLIGGAAFLQLAMPIAAFAVALALGQAGTAAAAFLVLMLAAPSITGGAHMSVMCGADPASALRQLVFGTAVLPLTVIPVFWLVPSFGETQAVVTAAGGLLLVVGGAAGLAFAIRLLAMPTPSQVALDYIDGLSAIGLAILVIGLMSAVGPAMLVDPLRFAIILGLVCLFNFTLQIVASLTARAASPRYNAVAVGIVTGNRNIALFLSVLPHNVVDPLLLYIGCYQIPMFLTPALLGGFYHRFGPAHLAKNERL